jgi:pyruvate carboxylase
MGFGDRFDDVKQKYVQANEILGDIVKVTPSSKMVGDLAIFMMQNELTPENIVERGKSLAFPASVVGYFKGLMGQPTFGFPKDLQEVVLKGEKAFTNRPGEELEPVDLEKVKSDLAEQFGVTNPDIEGGLANGGPPNNRDAVSWCLYPKVYEDFCKKRSECGDISRMASHVYFMGMLRNEFTEITVGDGNTAMIKFIGLGEINDDGTQTIQFELNGVRRDVSVKLPEGSADLSKSTSNTVYADLDDHRQVGSSIPGGVSKVFVKKGDKVKLNQPLFIIEAMKMETTVMSKVDGVIDTIHVQANQTVKAGELIVSMR